MKDVSKAPYNAALNGVTNDSAAIQAALDDCATSGEDCYIPRPSNAWCYCGTTGLTMNGGFRLFGEASQSLFWSTSFTGTGLRITQPLAIVENIGFQLPRRATAPGSSILGIKNESHSGTLRDVRIGSYGAGTYQGWYAGAQLHMHVHALFNARVAAHYNALVSQGVTGLGVFEGTYASGHAGAGQNILINGGSGISVFGAKLEGPARNALRADSNGANVTLAIIGNWMEAQEGEQIYLLGTASARVRSAFIKGNFLSGGAGINPAVSAIFANYIDAIESGANGMFNHTRCGVEIGAVAGDGIELGEDYFMSAAVGYLKVIRNDTPKERFFGGGRVAKQTGVPVTAAGIHAALVAMNIIAP